MATLEKIRKRGKIVMVVVFVALFCFVVGDALNNSNGWFNQDRDVVGEVCGKKIRSDEFQKQIDAFTNFNKMEGKEVKDGEVRNDAWQTFVIENILKDQMSKIGMSITAEELEYATTIRPHRDLMDLRILRDENNQFSSQRLQALLKAFKQLEENEVEADESNMQMQEIKNLYDGWLCVEKKLINSIAYEKLVTMTANAIQAPKAEKKFISQYAQNEIDYVSVFKATSTEPDSTFKMTDAEGKAEYEKVKKAFKTDNFRTIKAIVFNVMPSAEDSLEAKERAIANEKELAGIDEEEAYLLAAQESDPNFIMPKIYLKESEIDYSLKEFAFSGKKDSVMPVIEDGLYYKTGKILSDIVNRPDSVKISWIVLVAKDQNENIKEKADSIFGAIKGGASFAEMAEKFSADGSSKNKGEVGWIQEGIFKNFKDFDENAFTGKVGQMFQLSEKKVELIVKIDSMTAPIHKVKFAEVAVKIEAGSQTYRKYYDKASQYLLNNTTVEDFEKNAESEGLFVNEYTPIFENDYEIKYSNIENGRKIVSWAFKHNVGEITSQPFEFTNQCVIAAVTGEIQKGYLPYDYQYVKDKIERRVIDEKKAAAIAEEWKGKGIEECGVSKIDTIKGARFDVNYQDPMVLANISLLNENETSEPIKGVNGVYKVKVISKQPAQGVAPHNRRGEIESLFRNSIKAIIDKAEIEDNRSAIYN